MSEMLTGRRAFPGDDISDVLAAVLRQDINWSALPEDTLPRLRRLLERCVDRDVKSRLRDIGEARVALANSGAPETSHAALPAVSSARPSWIRDPRSMVALTAVVATVSLAGFALTRPAAVNPDPFPARIEISTVGGFALSPDGHSVVFNGRAPSGAGTALYLRRLDQLTSRVTRLGQAPGATTVMRARRNGRPRVRRHHAAAGNTFEATRRSCLLESV